MRLKTLSHLQPDRTEPLQFTGPDGEFFRIDVLDHDMIRVRHLPDGVARMDRTWMVVGRDGDVPLQGRSRDDLSPFPLPAAQITSADGQTVVRTDVLRLEVDHQDARLQWYDADGRRFAADLKHRGYVADQAGRGLYHYLERRTDEHYYGFGERAGTLDKYGMRMEMRNLDALGYNAETSDPLYKHVPFYITYIPELNTAYGLVYDNLATSVFDMGREIDAFWGFYRTYHAADGDLDYTLIYGPSIANVVQKYTALTGRPALLPRWSLGYLGSTMKYTEAPDAQAQLKQFVDLCAEHEIPCDLFHLSSGYTTDERGTRFVFTWNLNKVPEPKTMASTFRNAGIHLAANIKPYLLTSHPEYAALAKAGGLIRNPDTGEPALCRFWSGGAFESGEGAYVDFSSEAGFHWWKDHVESTLMDYGIDGAWNDNNEFELWDDAAVCDGFGRPFPIGLGRGVQTLLMARSSYEASLNKQPGLRPFILSRSGCAGIQRYVQTWSGDNETSWHTLKFNIPMGLGMGLSGFANTGHDVGGFFGPAPDPELLVRWVQSGIFHPRFTIHSWNTDGTVNEPWMHPEVLPIIRETMQLRYRLIPYLYTLMAEAHRTGTPIIRPLVYHFAHDERCRTESFDYLLGSHLLVASVVEQGARTRTVYLPAGTWWCDFYSGQWYEGGQEITADAPLERTPLFVADGGVIPLGKTMRYVGESADDEREIRVFARDSASFTLFEDDGVSLDVHQGGYATVHVQLKRENGAFAASAERVHSGYVLPYDAVTVVLVSDDDMPLAGGERVAGRWQSRITLT